MPANRQCDRSPELARRLPIAGLRNMDRPAQARSRKLGNMPAAVMALGAATSSWQTMDEILGKAGEMVLHNEIPRNGRYSLQQTFVRDRLYRRKLRALSNFSPPVPYGNP